MTKLANRDVMKIYLRFLSLLCLSFFLQSCKILQVTPAGGSIVSASGTLDCPAGETCLIDIENGESFSDTFKAVPDKGFKFKGWKEARGHLCGGDTEPCELLNVSGALTKFDAQFLVSPVFEAINLDSRTYEELPPLITEFHHSELLFGYAVFDANNDGYKDVFFQHYFDRGGNQVEEGEEFSFFETRVGSYIARFRPDGTLCIETESYFEGGVVPTIYGARETLVADFNGDGFDDVIFASNNEDGRNQYWRGFPIGYKSPFQAMMSTGKGKYQVIELVENTIFYVHGISAGDLDGDGDLDLIAGGWGLIDTVTEATVQEQPDNLMLLNDGSGNFSLGIPYEEEEFGVGWGSTHIADLDNDGTPEVIVGSYPDATLRILKIDMIKNTYTKIVDIPLVDYYLEADATYVFTEEETLHSTEFGDAYNQGLVEIKTLDINQDGLKDLVLMAQALLPTEEFNPISEVRILINKGDLKFEFLHDSPAYNLIKGGSFIQIIDADEDGLNDIVVDSEMPGDLARLSDAVLYQQEDGTFARTNKLQFTDDESDGAGLFFVDMDGDGDLDILKRDGYGDWPDNKKISVILNRRID